jgi:hypothetical protein
VEGGGQQAGVEHVRHLHAAPAAARAPVAPAVEPAAGVRIEAELPAMRERDRPRQRVSGAGQREEREGGQAKANTTPSTT